MMMRSTVWRLFLILVLAVTVSGCEIIGGIFKAGVWVGVIGVVLVLALVLWLFGKARG
jgi:hypothetical protein